jgi:hypothetical protein
VRGTPVERFLAKVRVVDTFGCWEWQASKVVGYGNFWHRGKVRLAHRVSLEILDGQHVPDELDVMHGCDNPACVNPAHLTVCTHLENMQDRDAKGRNADQRCSKNGRAKLDDADAALIFETQMPTREAVARYGISRQMAHRIRTGQAWKGLRS